MLRTFGLILLVNVVLAAAPPQPTVRSAALAQQLGAALVEHRLEAIAVRDPEQADRFIAALFFPDSQLLVISARYASPSLLEEKIAHMNYRDVYLDLGTSHIADTSVFFQDMKADGLCNDRDQTADILYEGSASTTFDGDWKKHGLSEQEYTQKLADADQRYSRLIELLLTQLRGA
jgi:hypothetical protein